MPLCFSIVIHQGDIFACWTSHGIGVNNGTDFVHLTFRGLEIGP